MAQKSDKQIHLFRTVIDFPENPRKFDHTSTILSLGSCFSEYIVLRLKDFLFKTCINPTGILYNPASISHALRTILTEKIYTQEDLFSHEGLWKSFNHHSSFNGKTPQEGLEKINSSIREAITCMEKLDVLILTFGTAFVFQKKDSSQLVANCHRLPNATFQRSLLSIEDIVTDYTELFSLLYDRFPELNIIITISPVRHLRDNPHENQVSKAHLISALFELETSFPKLYYFPSYEIMIDELRDYRFYNNDMAHPAPVSLDYMWEKFLTACASTRALEFVNDYTSIYQSKKHQIMDSSSELTAEFAKKQMKHIDNLESKFPEILLTDDKDYFTSILTR